MWFIIRYNTEVEYEASVEADSEEEAIKKLEDFDIEEDPQEVSGGGFSEDEMISIEEQK